MELDDNESHETKARLNALLGTFVTEQGEQNYFEAFNQAVNTINQLLEQPKSEVEKNQKSYQLQEEYNNALEVAKARWTNGEKEFGLVTSVAKELSARKKLYEQGLEDLITFEKKVDIIDSFSTYEDPNSTAKEDSPWSRLHKIACDIDKNEREAKKWTKDKEIPETNTRESKLKQCRLSWQSQGILAKCNMQDLLNIEKEFDNIQAFIDYIEKAVPQSSTNRIDRNIRVSLSINKRILNRYREKCESTYHWKLQAASFAGNLRCDDSLLALTKALKLSVFDNVGLFDLESISDLLEVPKGTISFSMNFKQFGTLLKRFQSSSKAEALKKWLMSRWATNPDNENLIKVTAINGYLIPTCVVSLVPSTRGYTPGSWIRYWFFRTNEIMTGVWRWLRNKLVGHYQETATLVNESYRQISNFEILIKANRNLGNTLNLNYISESSAFLAGLELPNILNDEMKRGEALRPSWTMGVLLKWVPLFNRARSYNFFALWRNELTVAKQAIHDKCQNIAKYLVDDFESLLANSISQKSFLFPQGLMADLECFVKTYGTTDDFSRFKEISDPITILQKFDFLNPPVEKDNHRTLNSDAIFAFLRFAEKYWTQEQVTAVKAIVDIILRNKIPKNVSEDEQLKKSIICLLKDKDKSDIFKKLMEKIAIKYLFTTGDDNNDDAYHFLERFAPSAFETWKAKRIEDIEDKFILLNNILSTRVKREMDLSGEDIYEAGSTQLKYKNFALYLNDIINADKMNGTHYKKLLTRQAEKYVRAYKGENARYADFLLKLCNEGNIDLLKEYVKKRFTNLFELSKSKEAISTTPQEYQFYAQFSKYPDLIAVVQNVINEKYQGQEAELAEEMLSFNHPEITALYFGKHVEYLVVNEQWQKLVRDKDLYKDFFNNPSFVKYLDNVFTQYFERLIKNEEWGKLESSDLSNVVEQFGNLQNKETYRLLRIKRLLKKNDTDSTKAYLSEVKPFLSGTLETTLITLPKAKALLLEAYAEHLKECQSKKKWEGHFQYFLEFFLPSENKQLLYDIRLLWLENYLCQPEKFADADVLERSFLEAKVHSDNKEVPNDETNIASFYGNENLPYVRSLLMNMLDTVNDQLDDEHVRLIKYYLRDNAFNLEKSWPLFNKKFEMYQKGMKIAYCLKFGSFFDAVKLLEDFEYQVSGLETLNQESPDFIREQVIAYNKQITIKLMVIFYDCLKETIINPRLIEKIDTTEFKEYTKTLVEKQNSMVGIIDQSNLSSQVKEIVKNLAVNANMTSSKLCQFISNLNFGKLHLIDFDEKDIEQYNVILSKAAQEAVVHRVQTIKEYLSEDDPLTSALEAFSLLLVDNYKSQKLKEKDLEILRRFGAIQRNYPEMANQMADKLIASLLSSEELTSYNIFKDPNGSSQNAFINHISGASKNKLITSLKSRIEELMITDIKSSISKQRTEWLCHGKLFEWLIVDWSSQSTMLRMTVNQWAKESLIEATSAIQTLLDKFDNIILKKNSLSVKPDAGEYHPDPQAVALQQNLLQKALFVRSFGDDEQKKVLDKMLAEIAKRQRRSMMSGLSGPFAEHCLDFTEKLLNLAGSEQQRKECIRLIKTWNRYHSGSLKEVRSLAIEESIPKYIAEIDNSIYQYFIKKHNLSDEFTQLMRSKLEGINLKDEFIEPSQLLKAYPIASFLQLLTEHARTRTHGFFYSKPSENDAQKLFVAFAIAVQAHQLATIWQKSKGNPQQGSMIFKPEDISRPLSLLVNNLSKRFDIGRGEFNRSITQAILKDSDFFASWSVSVSIQETINPLERDKKAAVIK